MCKTLYEEYVSDFLKKQIDIGRKKFVLYPNGEVAKIVKNILIFKYNIVPEYTVDNYSFNGKTILNLEHTKSLQQTDVYYLICSDIKALINCGIAKEDAYSYSTLGCVELTIAGKEFTHTEGARINWLKILELMIFGGMDQITGKVWKLKEKHDLNEFQDFNQFYDWYKVELENAIDKVAEFIEGASFEYYKEWPTPYLSSITYGCIENGSDITYNGTKYYNLSINCVGMANTVDSLEAIENIIFKEKNLHLMN